MARSASVTSPRKSRPHSQPPAAHVLGFMRLMWAVDHALQRASKQMNRAIGLTGPQRLVIRLLGRTPGMSAGQLATELHLDPSTLTGILQRLESRRIVARATDPSDARRLKLSLSSRGEEFDTPVHGTIEAAITKAIGRHTERDIKAASTVLASIGEELSAIPQKLQKHTEKHGAAGRRRRASR